VYSQLVLFAIGLLSGLASGLLGIGGGIVLAPLLLYLAPALGHASIGMKAVSGLTMVQSCAASLAAARVHHRFRFVHRRLVAVVAVPLASASFAGAFASRFVDARALLALFAGMALIAAALMCVPKPQADVEAPLETVSFRAPLAVGLALVLGSLGGLVGQSGSFLLIPVLIYVLHIPTRIALGSSLGIVLCAAVSGTVGKVLAGQVDVRLVLPLVPGALLGAHFGGHWSRRVPMQNLRYGVGLVSAFAAVRILYGLNS
jgi:uncharacterized membrane protein YfcA